MQKILITGANGFLGEALCRLRLSKPVYVQATGRGECRLPFQHPNFQYNSLDFTDKASIKKLFGELKPGVVVHAGAASRPDFCEAEKENAFRINVTGTQNLLEASQKQGAHFIFLSSDFVFSGDWEGSTPGFYKEDNERSPVNFYGQTKLLAEDEVMKYGGDWSIVRTAMVYGKPQSGRDNLVSNVAKALENKQPLTIFHDQVRTPTFVDDLATGIIKIIEAKASGIFHLAGDEVFSLYEMAITTAHFLNKDASVIKKIFETDLPQAAKRPKHTCLDISKAKQQLHFAPRSFKQGLREMFE
ncbi:MAG: SDR family oxidoreductase [Flavisolibacter sp.]